MQPVIKAENLTKRFQDLVAVDHVSFETQAGQCFGFLGPNGAGKTSTIRMIYGFSPNHRRKFAGFRERHSTALSGNQNQDRGLPSGKQPRSGLHGLGKFAGLCPVF